MRSFSSRRPGSRRARQLGLGDAHPLPVGVTPSPISKPALANFKSGPIGTLVGDVVKMGVDVFKAGADALSSVVHFIAPGLGNQTGSGSGSGGGGTGGAGHDSPSQPPPASDPSASSYPSVPAAGGGESAAPAPTSPMRPSMHAPGPVQTPSSSTDPSYGGTADSTASSNSGATNVGEDPTKTRYGGGDGIADSSAHSSNPLAHELMSGSHPNTSATQLPMPSSNPSHSHSTGSGKPSHRFPLAAAAALGAILSFLVVSALIWGLWFYLIRRRKRARKPHYVFASSKRGVSMAESMFTILSASTVPHFISATEAGHRDGKTANPFAHPAEPVEEDPFSDDDALSLRRASTQRTTSTLSV